MPQHRVRRLSETSKLQLLDWGTEQSLMEELDEEMKEEDRGAEIFICLLSSELELCSSWVSGDTDLE